MPVHFIWGDTWVAELVHFENSYIMYLKLLTSFILTLCQTLKHVFRTNYRIHNFSETTFWALVCKYLCVLDRTTPDFFLPGFNTLLNYYIHITQQWGGHNSTDFYTVVIFWLMYLFCWNLVLKKCQTADKVRIEIMHNRGTYYISILVWITSH